MPMTAKKLFVPVLSAVFLASSVGLAAAQAKPEPAAQEKKGAEESKKIAEPTPGKAVVAPDLKDGDPVHVLFSDADGKRVAKAVTVKAGGTAKKEEKMEK